MEPYEVTVTGATGKTGREVVTLARARGWRVRAAARRRPQAGEWVRLDYADAQTWPAAFRGVDAAYVIVPFTSAGAAAQTPALLRAAAAAGVRRIVLLSSLDAAGAPADDPLRRAEDALLSLDVAWAVLRPTWFLDNFTSGSLAAMTAAGDLRLPAGDGRIPFVAVRDVAAVAAAALAPDGPTGVLPLTGPRAVDHGEVAAALTRALSRPVRYTPVAPEEFVAALTAAGFAPDYGAFLAAALTDVASGRLVIPVSDAVRRATGRPATSLDDFAASAVP